MPSTVHVELECCLTFHETLLCHYLHSRWCNFWSNWNVLADIVLLASLILGLPKLIFRGAIADGFFPSYGVSLLLLAGVLGLVVFLIPYLVARQRYKGPDLSGRTHYSFDQIGYEVIQPGWQYRVEWVDVREIRESKTIFFLYLLPTQSTIIPKRIFPDGQTLAVWRSLIAASAPSVLISRNSIVGRFL